MPRAKLPGCIYRNGRCYWWLVRLPGESKRRARPLREAGARYATSDRRVAEAVARQLYREALLAGTGEHVGQTVADLVAAYVAHARAYYRPTPGAQWSELMRIETSSRPLLDLYGAEQAERLSPADLIRVRQSMIERGLARRTINDRVAVIRRMYRWAVTRGVVPPGTYQALAALEGLRQGRSAARETPPRKPVAENVVEITTRYLPATVAAMVDVQLLTGMRSGELCNMRPADIDQSGTIWLYRPVHHKTERHGHGRTVTLGPRAQRVLGSFIERALRRAGPSAYLFSPAEAERERAMRRRADRKTPLYPSHVARQAERRKRLRARPPGERYTSTAYRRAVTHGISAARRAGENVPDWTPHQLRHTAATRIRRAMGLDAARAVLGHRHLAVTDTYAELDKGLAVDVARRLG